jgi:DNA invertase Pin-like site-specific DNA recombinase
METNQQRPNTAAIYLRTASKSWYTVVSIIRQHDACIERANALGVTSEKIFLDRGVSGNTLDRPALKHLVDYVAAHRVRYVIASTPDRLARNPEGSARLRRRLEELGCTVEVASQATAPEYDELEAAAAEAHRA